jgi:hypothetical protein
MRSRFTGRRRIRAARRGWRGWLDRNLNISGRKLSRCGRRRRVFLGLYREKNQFPIVGLNVLGLDTTGGTRLGRGNEWIPCDSNITASLTPTIENSASTGVSDLVPALLNALKLPLPQGLHERIHICVIGDESTAEIEAALRAIEGLNPSDFHGGLRATISAVQVPTIVNICGRMGRTGLQFETLMSEVAARHGGSFRMLAGVDRL